jgi:type I restriction enzyme R subunit
MKTEQQTRIELIDAALEAAGWKVGDPSQVVMEYDIVVDPELAAERATANHWP